MSINYELLKKAFSTDKPKNQVEWETHEGNLRNLLKPMIPCKMRHGTKVELSDLPIYKKPLWGE
jgi:hypothetical protein